MRGTALTTLVMLGLLLGGAAGSARSDDLRAVPARMAAPADSRDWAPESGRAPQCLAASRIGQAVYIDRQHVDLIDAAGRRYRLELTQPCAELSYYHSFYYRIGKDGAFCARRDHLVARAGRICDVSGIVRLRPLVPKQSRARSDRQR